MVKFSIACITSVLLLGCTSKSEKDLMEVYSKKISYHKQLQKTEKIQYYQDNETKVLLTATYLYTSNFESNDRRDEVFVVGLYSNNKSDANLNSSKYDLTLNGQKPKEIKALSLSDEHLKDLSFVTNWGYYYLVTFPHTENKKVTFTVESKSYGKGTMDFAKVAKFVLEKEAF